MYRASQLASEETLPALGLLALGDGNEAEASSSSNGKRHGNGTTKPQGYGLVTVLSPRHRLRYPKAVIFVLLAKLFEAFAANGIRTILALYLRDDLYFSQSLSTILLHVFNFFGQFCPIFGAILSDSYLGNARTINYFYAVYGLGWILLIFTSLPYVTGSLILLVSLALLLIAIANGSSRACLTSLGAIQFQLPQQAKQLADFFSLYYFVYYVGIFLSKVLPPTIRANTSCFNKQGCYPAVFGTLGASFFLAWLMFGIGKFFYKDEKLAEENVLVKLCGCIEHALANKWSKNAPSKSKHSYWLHYAIGRYEEAFVNDVAKVLKLTKVFLPLTVYYALLAQQDSSWTFQASLMNTTLTEGITIEPDQAKAMGPIFLFILIPLWQYALRPLLHCLCGCEVKPLQSAVIGGIFSTLSFLSAGVLQKYIMTMPYKSVSVVWQVPQFIFIMLGELLLSIPGLQFAFTQAPESMKSVVTATWFLNNAFGNLMVIIITEFNMFTFQSNEYFFYAILMAVAVIIYAYLASDYVLQERLGHHFYSQDTLERGGLSETHRLLSLEELDKDDNTPSSSNNAKQSINVL